MLKQYLKLTCSKKILQCILHGCIQDTRIQNTDHSPLDISVGEYVYQVPEQLIMLIIIVFLIKADFQCCGTVSYVHARAIHAFAYIEHPYVTVSVEKN